MYEVRNENVEKIWGMPFLRSSQHAQSSIFLRPLTFEISKGFREREDKEKCLYTGHAKSSHVSDGAEYKIDFSNRKHMLGNGKDDDSYVDNLVERKIQACLKEADTCF